MEDLGSIPGLARSPGERKGYPLQYFGLENSMDCAVHGVAKSRTQQSDFCFHFCFPFKQFNFKNSNKIQKLSRDYVIFEYNKSTCGNPLVKIQSFHCLGPGVQSLVREKRSQKLSIAAKKKSALNEKLFARSQKLFCMTRELSSVTEKIAPCSFLLAG